MDAGRAEEIDADTDLVGQYAGAFEPRLLVPLQEFLAKDLFHVPLPARAGGWMLRHKGVATVAVIAAVAGSAIVPQATSDSGPAPRPPTVTAAAQPRAPAVAPDPAPALTAGTSPFGGPQVVRARTASARAARPPKVTAHPRARTLERHLLKHHPSIAGPNTVGAGEIVRWYRAQRLPDPRRTLGIPLPALVNTYLTEGRREGIRGDVAFVNAVVTTHAFTTDSAQQLDFTGGLAGARRPLNSPRAAVREHIQLLKKTVHGNHAKLSKPDIAPRAPVRATTWNEVVAAVPAQPPGGEPTAAARADIPPDMLMLYREAGARYGLDWSVLAAIGKVESDHFRNPDARVANSAGAIGPMQFLPSTFDAYGVDAPGDGKKDSPQILDTADAIFSAANMLRSDGAPGDWQSAIFSYNHAQWYVDEVLAQARVYSGQDAVTTSAAPVTPPPPAAVISATADLLSSAGAPALATPAAPGYENYVNPFAGGDWTPYRTDQGVDWIANTPQPVKAIGDGEVTYSQADGWGDYGGFMVYRLDKGAFAGRYIYVAENLTDMVPAGTPIKAGDTIAVAQTAYPHTEWGWAAPPGTSPTAATPYNSADYEQPTPGGEAFARFLHTLGAPWPLDGNGQVQDWGTGPVDPNTLG
jgi:murein DD-endopeptidase MepM/ murein hydrolase activator NlpD